MKFIGDSLGGGETNGIGGADITRAGRRPMHVARREAAADELLTQCIG
jgi:hypothetical protein